MLTNANAMSYFSSCNRTPFLLHRHRNNSICLSSSQYHLARKQAVILQRSKGSTSEIPEQVHEETFICVFLKESMARERKMTSRLLMYKSQSIHNCFTGGTTVCCIQWP